MADSYPQPGPSEFSADQEQAMRESGQNQAASNITPHNPGMDAYQGGQNAEASNITPHNPGNDPLPPSGGGSGW